MKSNFWNSIINSMKGGKTTIQSKLQSNYSNTSKDLPAIMKRLDSKGNKDINVVKPTSYRTENKYGDTDIGLTSGKVSEVESTAIESARYDPSDDSLNITYKGGDKEYKFKATPDDVKEWMSAPSKGQITNEWKTTHRYPGY